ncbi:MAG: porin, partial [Pseudomonadota bacterium]
VTERAGTFSAGQGSMVGDGIAEFDLSGTGLVTEVAVVDIAGGYKLRRVGDTATVPTSGIEISDAFDNFDGSRRGRVRYDSPSFAGFKVGASWGRNILSSSDDDTYYDFGITYESEFNGAQLEGGIAYQVRDRDGTDDNTETVVASGAVLLPSGLNVAVSLGTEQDEGTYYYGKIGYKADWLAIGTTAVAVDYYMGDDMVSDGDSSAAVGLGLVQKIDDLNLEAYLGYYHYSYEDTTSDFEDASSIIVGARWRF